MVLVERWLLGELASVLGASKVEVPVAVWVCEEHWGACDQYEGEGRGVPDAPQ